MKEDNNIKKKTNASNNFGEKSKVISVLNYAPCNVCVVGCGGIIPRIPKLRIRQKSRPSRCILMQIGQHTVWTQDPVWNLWEKKNLFAFPDIESRFRCHQACNPITILTQLTLLPCLSYKTKLNTTQFSCECPDVSLQTCVYSALNINTYSRHCVARSIYWQSATVPRTGSITPFQSNCRPPPGLSLPANAISYIRYVQHLCIQTTKIKSL